MIQAGLTINPDTVLLSQGDRYQFIPVSFDQCGLRIDATLDWSANGGEIDSDGVYLAGYNPGTYVITAKDNSTGIEASSIAIVDETITSVEGTEKSITEKNRISKVYPNPFSNSATIQFIVDDPGSYVLLTISDHLGRKVAVLADGILNSGEHKIKWQSNDIQNGVYIYSLRIGKIIEQGKLILMR